MRIGKNVAILAFASLLLTSVFLLLIQRSTSSPAMIARNIQAWKNSVDVYTSHFIDMTPDNKYVVAGDQFNQQVCLLNETGKKLWKFNLTDTPLVSPMLYWVCISNDGNYIAFGGYHFNESTTTYEGFIFFFDRTGHVWNKTDFTSEVVTGAISGDGSRLAIGYGNRVEAYDSAGIFQWGYDADDKVSSVSISSLGDYVAFAYRGGICLLYEGALVWKRITVGSYDGARVRISSDAKYVIGVNDLMQNVTYFNQTGSMLWNQTIEYYDYYDAAITPNGEYAVAVGNSTIYYFNRTGLIWSYDTGSRLWSVDISSDGYFIVASSWDDGKVFHLNMVKTLVWELTSWYAGQVAISANGEYFAYGDNDYNVFLYFSKKYFNYRFVTPDTEPISNLNVTWYFTNGTLYTSMLTNGTGWIQFFDPYYLDYSTSAYYWQTKVGSYVLVNTNYYESVSSWLASLFDWNIYIHDAGGAPISARVETYLWNDTLYDNSTTDTIRLENMPNQTYTIKVYYQSARGTWSLANQSQIALTQEEQNTTITINVLDYHVKCVNHYNEPVSGINVSIGIDGYPEWMRELTNATGFADFQNILNDTYRVIAYYKGVVVANVTDTVTAQNQVKTVELFLIGDTQPPTIDTPSHKPQQPNSTDTVKVSVNVTDDLSGIHDVILSYRTNINLTWTNVTMTYNSTSLLYEGNILPQPPGTNVTYMITAHDNAGKQTVNDNLGSYFTYRVAQIVLDYHVKCVNHYSEPVPDVNVSLYFTNGTLLMQETTNATGFVDFLDILSDFYRVIAEYKGVVVANVTDTVATQDQITTVELFLIGDSAPPTTDDDYDDLWHTTNFRINLIATDDLSGVHETYYKINDGPIQNVTAYGQPLITTEGSNNKLEYWSIDNAGKEESHHILTGIKLDKTAPTGSILINNGNTYTTSTSVTLNLTYTDTASGVYQVRYSNDGVWDTEPWESPSPTKSWTLMSGDGTRTAYYQIKDNVGLISITYSDTIILDTVPPTGSITISGNATYTNSTSVTLTLSANDATSGMAQMRFSNDNTTWSSWGPYSNSKTWNLTTVDGTKTVYVQYEDNAGLVSIAYFDTIILDKTAPTIAIPSREPAGDVQPYDTVKVSVNVTDITSLVKDVTLYYTTNNGTTWTVRPTTYNSSTKLYETTIPQQTAGTWVKYKIIAYDNAENNAILDGTQPYCVYQVIPEFPSIVVLPLFIVLTTLAIILTKKRLPRRTSKL